MGGKGERGTQKKRQAESGIESDRGEGSIYTHTQRQRQRQRQREGEIDGERGRGIHK